MLGLRFDCISHEPVYLSRIIILREREFPRHADYVKEFETCVIKSKVNTSDLQMGYRVNSQFVEGLLNKEVRQQYIIEVYSKMAFRDPIWFRHACGDDYRSLHGSRLPGRGSSECIKIDERYKVCCSFETFTSGGSTNVDFNNVSFESYANATGQPHANSECSSNVFGRA